jgi:hypothetical protein
LPQASQSIHLIGGGNLLISCGLNAVLYELLNVPVSFVVMNDVGMPVESLYFRAMILRV